MVRNRVRVQVDPSAKACGGVPRWSAGVAPDWRVVRRESHGVRVGDVWVRMLGTPTEAGTDRSGWHLRCARALVWGTEDLAVLARHRAD